MVSGTNQNTWKTVDVLLDCFDDLGPGGADGDPHDIENHPPIRMLQTTPEVVGGLGIFQAQKIGEDLSLEPSLARFPTTLGRLEA